MWIVKCDTTYPVLPDTLDSPAESVPLNRMSCILHLKYQNILCRNKSFILKQHRTRDTCNNETGHSYCHLKHAASLINYASWNPLLPMKEMSHMTLHLIAIWHLKRTIQHGMQLLSAQIHTQKGLDDVLLSQGWCPVLRRTAYSNVFWLTVFVSTAQSSHARSKLQLVNSAPQGTNGIQKENRSCIILLVQTACYNVFWLTVFVSTAVEWC